MSWIAGIDFSTFAIDVVLIDEDGELPPRWERWTLEGQDAFDRCRQIDHVIASDNRWGDIFDSILAVGIEDPAGHHGTSYLYRIQGAILACIWRKVLVKPWRPSEWRKAVGLPGNCGKEAVAQWAERNGAAPLGRWEPLTPSSTAQAFVMPVQDALDAFCIALATRQAIDKPHPNPQVEGRAA